MERARELYIAGNFIKRNADPAALTVKGRLLKARGRLAKGIERRALLAQAATAYAQADRLSPAPYLAINAATLNLLAGDSQAAAEQAKAVLVRLDGREQHEETPYFLAATRAEALLLIGDRSGAERAMRAAIAFDPDGLDDRAATVGQLRAIVDALGADTDWLNAFAPPVSLHFAGHMGITSGGASEALLHSALDTFLGQTKPGFAWGALATGSDLVIAERLLNAGCLVHAVLPCPAEIFETQSVVPAGPEWVRRFRAVLEACASTQIANFNATSAHDPLATEHAGELAIGSTIRNAARYSSRAAQLIIIDADGGGKNTARQASLWDQRHGGQHRLTVSRDLAVEALFPAEQFDPARRLALLVSCRLDELAGAVVPASDRIAALTDPIATALSELPQRAIRARPGLWEFACESIEQGAAAMSAIFSAYRSAGVPPPSIGAHLAISSLIADPVTGTMVPYGPGPGIAARLMELAPPGVALASEALAATLTARRFDGVRLEPYLLDDTELGGTAFLLT